MATTKITRGQVRPMIVRLAKSQGGICPLCDKPLNLSERGSVVLDHDHETGLIRGALHRSCNSGEGKARLAIGKWIAGKVDQNLIMQCMERIMAYYKQEPSKHVYYSHKTPDEEKAARAAKERKRRAEKKARRMLKRSTLD